MEGQSGSFSSFIACVLRATTEKRSSSYFLKNSAPSRENPIATPMNLCARQNCRMPYVRVVACNSSSPVFNDYKDHTQTQRYVGVAGKHLTSSVTKVTHDSSTLMSGDGGRPGPLVTSAVLAWIRSSWLRSSTCLAVFLLARCCWR